MEMNVRGDLWQSDSSKSEREYFSDRSETYYDVWLETVALTKKTGSSELEVLRFSLGVT